jgi:hypothetical protein
MRSVQTREVRSHLPRALPPCAAGPSRLAIFAGGDTGLSSSGSTSDEGLYMGDSGRFAGVGAEEGGGAAAAAGGLATAECCGAWRLTFGRFRLGRR